MLFFMMKQWCRILAFSLILVTSLSAGSRGVALSFLDATTGERSQASLRLAELLEKDMRALYEDPNLASSFPWSEQDLKLKILDAGKTQISFDRLLNTKDGQKISALFNQPDATDALIVFYHDAAAGFARLKLYNWDGKELLLLRLPLEGEDSAMASSLMKTHRRGALIALGAAVRWNP